MRWASALEAAGVALDRSSSARGFADIRWMRWQRVRQWSCWILKWLPEVEERCAGGPCRATLLGADESGR